MNIVGKVVIDGKAIKKCLEIVSRGITAKGMRKIADAQRHARLSEAQTDADVRAIQDDLAAYQGENLYAIGEEALPFCGLSTTRRSKTKIGWLAGSSLHETHQTNGSSRCGPEYSPAGQKTKDISRSGH